MLLESGRVVAVDADSVWVETVRKSTCGSCSLQKGCGHSLMERLAPGHRPLVRVLPGRLQPADCQVDDEVQISIPESVLLRGSALVYVLPLLAMLAGGAGAAAVFPASADASAALGAVLGMGAGFALVRAHARRHRDDPGLQPSLERLLRRAGAPGVQLQQL
ncbi:transcriptional regulator [Mangrovimicrobium sediminis]|uniref:Transcriptional regulator n=1 Tax=Mangrovimicrobium sediminis TaxID=2562682 RepID=A0A4Z0M5G5_9GAMM|nr:SoxR reducing system RseC family protein [Haliea sp. SAOS-164]TGD74660.1 transcriptional regulator [Haliea sp. SAOS-164]